MRQEKLKPYPNGQPLSLAELIDKICNLGALTICQVANYQNLLLNQSGMKPNCRQRSVSVNLPFDCVVLSDLLKNEILVDPCWHRAAPSLKSDRCP